MPSSIIVRIAARAAAAPCTRIFHAADAVVHHASPTRGAVVVQEMMDGHRPAVWISDRYTAQQGHAAAHQTCLAHLARGVAYVVEVSDEPVPWRLQLWLQSVFALAERVTGLATSTLAAKRRNLDRQLGAILATRSGCERHHGNHRHPIQQHARRSSEGRGCAVEPRRGPARDRPHQGHRHGP